MSQFSPRTSITADQYATLVRLYDSEGRVAFYSYLYDLTGNQAVLEMGKVSSSSGVFMGGPAWVFNAILQQISSRYPQGPDAIEQFSDAIAARVMRSIVPDGEFGYLVP